MATHPLEPLHPHVTLGRLAAGAVGGIVGGLFFGVILLSDFLVDAELGGRGIVPLAEELLDTRSPMVIWAIHAATSIALGMIFSTLISPHSYRSSVLYALGYSQVVWLVGSLLLLRSLTGEPIAYDAAAVYSQIGHLLYGLGLGIFYVGFHHEEVRDAMAAESPKWRAWGERERQEEGNG